LNPDPAIALTPPDPVPVPKEGPLHRLQFVIEFVGPRSVPAAAARHLLVPNWYGALGQPQVFAMRAMDLAWHRMTATPDGSYDSIALAWDMVTGQGALTPDSAKNLLRTAEEFGPYISRRAMPMPVPAEVRQVVKNLQSIRDALDVGFTLSVGARRGGFAERDVWIECARLGLQFENGGFEYRAPKAPAPLFAVTPYGTTDAFSLGAVQAGAVHPGVTIGFSLPLSPAPTQGLEGALRAADHLAAKLDGVVLDESDQPLTDRTRQKLRAELRNALSLFSRAGITTGSAEAVRLFS
jgi:hypothetical protein